MQEKFFSELIFEGIVTEVNLTAGTCIVSPLSVSPGAPIGGIPIPVSAGNGNAGVFVPLKKGTRVVVASTSGRGRTSNVIIATLPKRELLSDNFNSQKPLDVPVGTSSYPTLVDGRVVMRGDSGSQVTLFETGDVCINTIGGSGVYLRRNGNKSAYTLVSEDKIVYTAAGRSISGPVRRISGTLRNLFPKEDVSQVPLYADTKYASVTNPVGFFPGSLPLLRSYNRRKRNPAISEYRMVINEFSTDSQFTGFDDEVGRVSGDIGLFDDQDTYLRNREQGNALHLAEHELIEVIGGNLVDVTGNILDINYRRLAYGGPNSTVPKRQLDISYDRARRISRRGAGYHFQLTTNTLSGDESTSSSNFVFDVDKEGMLKINIPSSSDTGNIPFVSTANFLGSGDGVDVDYLNPSSQEPIPVTLRDSNGEIVFPNEESQGITHRDTGLRFSNSDENPYFPSGNDGFGVSDPIRVNTTQYHNMYSAGERLIANLIKVINIPNQFVNDNGFVESTPVGQPFEIPVPDELNEAEDENNPSVSDVAGEISALFNGGSTAFPNFMGTVAVDPGPPALYPGGDTLVAGVFYPDDDANPPFSNSFESTQEDGTIGVSITDENGDKRTPVGGKSVHMNLGGSIEASIGKDNYDEKSVLLDTEGSIVTWLGKDRNNRSLVMQTDGEVLFNIGGSYEGSDPNERTMNVGRFELRVNVTDKGLVGTQFEPGDAPDEGGNPGPQSDFIISISENGIVIAGTKANSPMVIRNESSILIESGSGDVILKGSQVKTVEPKGRAKTPRSSGR